MRTNFVLIDLENLQPSLELITADHFKVLVFVGRNQTKLPFDIAVSLQKLGSNASYVKIEGNGPNALDFHIAYYIGKLSLENPTAYFHIISRDSGFDPLIIHLKSQKILAGRVCSIADIPILKAANLKSPGKRYEATLARLQQLKAAKPRKLTTLTSTISSLFQKQISDTEVQEIIQQLRENQRIVISGTKISYNLQNAGEQDAAANP